MVLPLQKPFRDIILDHLRGDPRSISAISRYLEEQGHPIHRLILTGYLRAMHDFGYLKERDIPPSKVFQAATPAEKDIYRAVGEALRAMDLKRSEQVRNTVYILNRLLHRPVFLSELDRCGFSKPIEAPLVEGADVQEARRMLVRGGLKIPRNDPAYLVEDGDAALFSRVVSELFAERFNIRGLMAGGTQLRLEGL